MWNGTVDKYLVIDSRKDGTGDTFIKVFASLSDANDEAARQWDYLVLAEQKKRRIVVGHVTNSDQYLNEDAFTCEAGIDYMNFHSYDTPDGAFDSEELCI